MIKAYYETFQKYKYLLQNLITRDFKVKYRRSVLGIAWSLLNPILMMLILYAVFSRMLGDRFAVEYYPLHIMMGQVLFIFFNEATNSANYSVIDSAALIKKVYIPKYLFPVEKVLFAFVNLIFSMGAILVMLFIFRVPFSWTMLLFPVPLIAMLGFTMGMGLILSALCVFFRDMRHLYTILTTAWMYLTPIIYPLEVVEESWIGVIVKINPLTWYVEYFRRVVLHGQLPTLGMNLICFGWAVVFMLIGTIFFYKTQDRFILHI